MRLKLQSWKRLLPAMSRARNQRRNFIALIDKYENFDTMTNTMLNEFVEKILVHERARKGSQDTTQEIEIYFNFLGRYIPPSLQPVPLTPEEQEETAEKRRTQGQASSELFEAESQRRTETV